MSDIERDDLDNLLKSAGFQRLKTWAGDEWSEHVSKGVENAANANDDVIALNRLRQVIAAKNAVALVLDWPARRLKELVAREASSPAPSMNRGGL